jgi:hypothetical protein
VAEEKASVTHGIDEMKVMKGKIDTIFSLILHVNSLVASTTSSTKHQSSLVTGTRTSLGEVVDLMNETMSSVEHTLDQMKKQRHEVSRLQHINQNLDRSSAELITAIQAVGMKSKQGTIHVNIEEMKQLLNALVRVPDIKSLVEDKHASHLHGILKKTAGIEAIWWKRAMAGELFISDEYVSAITKKPCITLSKSVIDDMGTPIGVVGIDLVLN